jgi:short-subunit dehydrogenase
LRILPLDVTDDASIRAVVAQAGPVDVLVNNAGIGSLAAVEAQSMAQVREIFETNTLGSIAMCQAFIPQMRERAQGVVINVTSSVTLRSLPLLAVYTASKAAVNAFTESMALELASVGVQARLVLPGRAPSTRFAENARPRMEGAIPDAYGALAAQVFANFQDNTQVTHASDVAEAVWQAATDPSAPMRIPAGEDAREWAATAV